MSVAPNFAGTPRVIDRGSVTAANTNRDGTGTIVTIASGVAAGTKIFEIVTQPIVTTTAGMIRIYLSVNSGTNWFLFDEIPVGAVTVSASVPGARNSVTYANLVLVGTAHRLGASTHNAEAHEVFALGADLT